MSMYPSSVEPKTQEEVKKQIASLKEIRPKVRPYSAFGDSNLDALGAQIKVLEEDMESDDIHSEFESENVRSAALDAREWIDGESEYDDLAEDYPLLKTD